LARKVAEAELAREQAASTSLFETERRDLAKSLFRAALAERVMEVSQEELLWLDPMVQTTEQRYRAGESSLVDLLRIQNERGKEEIRLETARQERTQAQLELNRRLNRALDTPWPTLRLPFIAGKLKYSPRLVELALANEPRLRILRREIAQAEATAQLTRQERLPEVSLSAMGRNYSGNGDFRQAEVVVGLTLPWGNAGKYRSNLERDQARAAVAQSDAREYSLTIEEEVFRLTVQADAARREGLLYRDSVIPRSEQASQAARAAWMANRGMFNDVLEARRMLLDGRLMYARAVADQYLMLSELVLCCGLGDFEALQMINAGPEATSNPGLRP
jgi:outer membrane protein TolC